MKLAAGVMLLVAVALVTTNHAQTPDGQTPAEETVCDNETGAAYGLCNAYCEAMDCDSDNPNANDQACQDVSEKFKRVTGRALPCEVVECFDANEFVGDRFEFVSHCQNQAGCVDPLICHNLTCELCEWGGTGVCNTCNRVLRLNNCDNVCP